MVTFSFGNDISLTYGDASYPSETVLYCFLKKTFAFSFAAFFSGQGQISSGLLFHKVILPFTTTFIVL